MNPVLYYICGVRTLALGSGERAVQVRPPLPKATAQAVGEHTQVNASLLNSRLAQR